MIEPSLINMIQVSNLARFYPSFARTAEKVAALTTIKFNVQEALALQNLDFKVITNLDVIASVDDCPAWIKQQFLFLQIKTGHLDNIEKIESELKLLAKFFQLYLHTNNQQLLVVYDVITANKAIVKEIIDASGIDLLKTYADLFCENNIDDFAKYCENYFYPHDLAKYRAALIASRDVKESSKIITKLGSKGDFYQNSFLIPMLLSGGFFSINGAVDLAHALNLEPKQLANLLELSNIDQLQILSTDLEQFRSETKWGNGPGFYIFMLKYDSVERSLLSVSLNIQFKDHPELLEKLIAHYDYLWIKTSEINASIEDVMLIFRSMELFLWDSKEQSELDATTLLQIINIMLESLCAQKSETDCPERRKYLKNKYFAIGEIFNRLKKLCGAQTENICLEVAEKPSSFGLDDLFNMTYEDITELLNDKNSKLQQLIDQKNN